MSANEKTLTHFTTRVRQLILQYKEIQKENGELMAKVEQCNARIQELEDKLIQARNNYNSLKMAKMIEISDSDMEESQKRLSKLIRDVNKCITLLSDK
jgi:phage shock protein A